MSPYRALSAVVLAAGGGTRMHSRRPKPLHLLCGRPMVLHVLDALAELPIDRVVVVVGHGAERVTKTLREEAPEDLDIELVEQPDQRGTGDAVAVGLTGLPDGSPESEDGDVLVLPGDAPLLRPPTLASVVRHHRASDAAATLLTARLDDASGHDRVLRGKDERICRVVDDAHATEEERGVAEITTGVFCFRRAVLAPALRRLMPTRPGGEFVLADTIEVLHQAGHLVANVELVDPMEAAGVNDRSQLAIAEAELRDRTNTRWMRRGVTMLDPETTYIDATTKLAPDVTLFSGILLQGNCVIEEGAVIGPDVHLIDTKVGTGARVMQCSARKGEIGAYARVGPYAVLDPGAAVADNEVTGPFFHGAAT